LELLSNMAIPYQQKLDLLEEGQLNSGKYLKDGDVIRCQIRSSNGLIDLGEQINKVVPSIKKSHVNSF
jgi:hypothetical protein